MVNYNNGKIYAIRSHQTDDVYIGSTCNPLCKRMAQHRCDYKSQTRITNSRMILKYDDAYIELIENFPCNTKEELLSREGHHIRTMPNCVNRCIVGRTRKEYQQTYKDKIAGYQATYRLENLDAIKEREKKYRKANKQKLAEKKKVYHEANKEIIMENKKVYYDTNKIVIKEKHKKYYEANKDKILEKHSIKRTCSCGMEYSHSHRARHERTKKHQDYLKTLSTEN